MYSPVLIHHGLSQSIWVPNTTDPRSIRRAPILMPIRRYDTIVTFRPTGQNEGREMKCARLPNNPRRSGAAPY